MGHEAAKTNRLRDETFKAKYFSGHVLDIGCGTDPVVPAAMPFDLEQGDANRILDYLAPDSFDCVHSSHCLEHMHNAQAALMQWWALVKPGGFLVLVVPDEDLYEQGHWPSLFNPDHKATFRLDKPSSWSPVSHDLGQLVGALPGCETVEIDRQDGGYDHSYLHLPRNRMMRHWQKALRWCFRKWNKDLYRPGPRPRWTGPWLVRFNRWLEVPIDQTRGPAVAQIQVILRKKSAD
jgi:SAM-dependent methyltransferase